jgi:hypothetical protein
MIRPRSQKAGKAESLFGDILKPFFDSIGHLRLIVDVLKMPVIGLIATKLVHR